MELRYRNCTNLLSNIPTRLTQSLLKPLKPEISAEDLRTIDYEGQCMNVPRAILDLLLERIDKVRPSSR